MVWLSDISNLVYPSSIKVEEESAEGMISRLVERKETHGAMLTGVQRKLYDLEMHPYMNDPPEDLLIY